ncbi:hypothetical protein JL475_35475 [Streptomyces sp. M2CJ-2]|uniref:hypothetical protein n=1 Tax=Streptomyces sp. M2CJ-2 TaxID=2803948 RepID=UPI0019263372|nr:hypothetical protein [Streptomyces sp. M2CJ-2]MBL3671141.1 hypothetical protein [Streptomyces sp. M2CJ-2]
MLSYVCFGGLKVPQIDTRLVQTAVIGGRDSDQPVILPEEPHNLDEFRRQFGTDRFWCGTLLGGCGEKLMTKRYETKVCHFSHYPDRRGDRAVCHRTANGVDSADHLFIKVHVTRWLANQGHAAQAELRSLGHGPGDAVDFWLRATEQHLRFELHPEDYRSWRKAADSLGAKEGHIEWVFGPDGVITRDMVARQGYALRVRCETKGNDRRVLIGTATENRTVAWAPLEQCRMTNSGLVTPALEELRAEGIIREGGMRMDPLPGSLPLRGTEIVFAVDTETAPPATSPFAVPGRHLVSGFVKPAGSRIIRAHLSLPEKIPIPTEQYVYQLSGAVRLLITDPDEGNGSSWAVRADSLVQLNGLDAERTGLWRPSVALDEQLDTAPRSSPVRTETTPAEPIRSRAATVLRQALERVAREGTTTTWHELARRTGLDLAHLPDPKRRDLLVAVDKPLSPDRPLLCVLIVASSGRPLPYLGTVLRLLGAAAPASETALRRWGEAAIRKAHEAYGHKPASVPTPSAASPTEAVADTKEATRHSDSVEASRQLVVIRARLREAGAVLLRSSGRRATRLAQAIAQGEAHAWQYRDARRESRTLRSWLKASDPVLNELDRLIGRPITPLEPASRPADSRNSIQQHFKARGGGPNDSTAVGQGEHDRRIEAARSVARISELFVTARIASDLAEAVKLRQEAERISDHELTGEVRERLHRLRADMREWISTRESEQAHEAVPAEDSTEATQLAAFAEARAEFEWLVQEIGAAQEAGDLAAVETARRLAGPVYARRLSPTDREKYTPFMREVKAWCHERDPKKQVDPPLRKIRQLLAGLGRIRETRSADELADTLDEIVRLRRQLAQPLPPAEDREVKRWRHRLKDHRPVEHERSAPAETTAPRNASPRQRDGTADPRHADRLPIETIDKLAAAVREILADAACSGGRLLTWRDLRLRMGGGLPHLHPDDQGELLVAVDRETPADEPLLSTLITSTDASLHWLYRHVRFSLGRERIPASELEAHWATEVLRLRQIWRYR